MLGAAVIVLVLVVVIPVTVIMSGALVAAVLGGSLKQSVETDHAGSELIELNR